MCEDLKIHSSLFEMDGKQFSLNDIQKVTILNEDAKYKGKTKPFSHQVLSGVTMLMPIAGNPVLYVGLRIGMKDGSTQYVYVSKKPVQINSDAYYADRKAAERLMEKLTKGTPSSVLQAEKNDPIL